MLSLKMESYTPEVKTKRGDDYKKNIDSKDVEVIEI
jgi:hypothetical protein